MSILIKGMDMPKAGELLCIDILPDGKVYIHLDLDCKQIATAVPVPKHGDLIDRDANLMSLRKVLYSPFTESGTIETAMLKACIKVFEEAPTIIEKEDKK